MLTAEEAECIAKKACDSRLDGVDFIAGFDYQYIASVYNGIGPSSMSDKDRKRLTKWLKLFEPACLIHDMRFELSDGTRYSFYQANIELRDNCLKLANLEYKWYNWKRYRARFVARAMYVAVCSEAGWKIWKDSAC